MYEILHFHMATACLLFRVPLAIHGSVQFDVVVVVFACVFCVVCLCLMLLLLDRMTPNFFKWNFAPPACPVCVILYYGWNWNVTNTFLKVPHFGKGKCNEIPMDIPINCTWKFNISFRYCLSPSNTSRQTKRVYMYNIHAAPKPQVRDRKGMNCGWREKKINIQM